jgi:hypothetical protein
MRALLHGIVEITELPPIPIPPEPPATTWPNEPPNMELVSDYGLTDVPPVNGDFALGNSGWRVIYNVPPGTMCGSEMGPPWAGTPSGYLLLGNDATAPVSAPSVYQFTYPTGMQQGIAPSTVYYWGIDKQEVYFAFRWKPSDPFDLRNNGTKIAFLFNGDAGGQQFIAMDGQRLICCLPEYAGHVRWLPRVNSTPVTLGVWHLIEWVVHCGTGLSRVYLDNIIQVEGHDVFHLQTFSMAQLSPTYGGMGSEYPKAQTDYYAYDHLRLCARQPASRRLKKIRADGR